MTKKKSKGAGGKQSRSEIIQARLSPRIRFAAELMARKERRTLSSMIELLIENAVKDFELDAPGYDPNTPDQIVSEKLEVTLKQLWSPDEAIRFVRLALNFPRLLNAEEELRWQCISRTLYFWRCYRVVIVDQCGREIDSQWKPHRSLEMLMEGHLHEYWSVLKESDIDREKLPGRDQVGGIISVKEEGKEEIATMEVPMDIDISPLRKGERRGWYNEFINYAYHSSSGDSADEKRYMADLVDKIIKERKDDVEIPETHSN